MVFVDGGVESIRGSGKQRGSCAVEVERIGPDIRSREYQLATMVNRIVYPRDVTRVRVQDGPRGNLVEAITSPREQHHCDQAFGNRVIAKSSDLQERARKNSIRICPSAPAPDNGLDLIGDEIDHVVHR